MVEGIAVVEGEAAPGVGCVGRGQFPCRPGQFPAYVEDASAFSQVDSLRGRGFVGPRVDGEGDADRGASLLGDDPDHSVVQVAVFGGWDARDDFHGLDVLDGNTPGADAVHPCQACVVPHPHSVDLDGRPEGSIAGGGATGTQGEHVVGSEVRIDGLAARHQGRYVRHAGHLHVVEGVPSYPAGGADIVFRAFCGDHHFLERQAVERHLQVMPGDVPPDVDPFVDVNVAKVGCVQGVTSFLHLVEGVAAILSGNGPEVVVVKPYDDPRQGFSGLGVRDLASQPERSLRHDGRGEKGQEEEK